MNVEKEFEPEAPVPFIPLPRTYTIEIEAIRTIVQLMDTFPLSAQSRILQYIFDRFFLSHANQKEEVK